MKPFRPLLLSLFSLVSYASLGLDEDAGYVPRNIQIEVQIVVLPEDLALPLIPELLNEKTIEAANAKVQALLAAKKAKLIGWPMLTTRNGQRAVTEAVDEIRFVAEYAPQNEIIGPTRFLNPGCITRPNRGAPASYAWLDLKKGEPLNWSLTLE